MGEAKRRIINGFEDRDGNACVVLDDGSHWYYRQGEWCSWAPPLPPEALGEVGEFQVDDNVTFDGAEGPCTVSRIFDDGYLLVTWVTHEGVRTWDTFTAEELTKVPR